MPASLTPQSREQQWTAGDQSQEKEFLKSGGNIRFDFCAILLTADEAACS
jgi:hypothetical protein